MNWWTEAEDEILREMWGQGSYASQIGQRLGKSKNSIVSRAHRLKLSARPSPIIRDGRTPKEPRKRRKNPERSGGNPLKALEIVSQPKGYDEPGRMFPSLRPLSQEALGPARFKTCQWIDGEPSADDACKCGQPVSHGVYCDEHNRRAYKAPPAREAA